jgi:hypothetical protein
MLDNDPGMDCDLVVALPRATAFGHTLFGQRLLGPGSAALVHTPAQSHAPEETVWPDGPAQARQTRAVLAVRRPETWGYLGGVNDAGLCVGQAPFRSRLASGRPGLCGSELVRLVLERCGGARQAADLAANLISRHGQGQPDAAGQGFDCLLLLADGREAFLLATAGSGWALQEVLQVRAAGGCCHLYQDWNRIAPGLADQAIHHGWWPDDGSKLDFEGALGVPTDPDKVRRWGLATRLLEEHNGILETATLRGFLDGLPTECEEPLTLLTEIRPDEGALAWLGFGRAPVRLYLPMLVGAGLSGDVARLRARLHEAGSDDDVVNRLAALQDHIDHETPEFLADAHRLTQTGRGDEVPRLSSLFMRHLLERCDDVLGQRVDQRVWVEALAYQPG